MTSDLQLAFTQAIIRSGQGCEYLCAAADFHTQRERTSSETVFDLLYSAVNDIRQWINERGLDAGTKAAREGQESIASFIALGGSFTSMRDSFGLDAGYYIARLCLNYDFIALGDVARVGNISQVEPVRYYNHSPLGHALFKAALGAGLHFSNAKDTEGRSAGFYVARCKNPEIIALYRQAGGMFSPYDRDALAAAAH